MRCRGQPSLVLESDGPAPWVRDIGAQTADRSLPPQLFQLGRVQLIGQTVHPIIEESCLTWPDKTWTRHLSWASDSGGL